MTDPRHDPWPNDPATPRPDSVGGLWGWIAGITVLALIAIILIAGWNTDTHVAATQPAATGASAIAPVPKAPLANAPHPSTTGAAPSSSAPVQH